MTFAAVRRLGPHLRTHAYREQSHVLLARGDWRGLRDLAEETGRLVARHQDTGFCYAVTTVFAFAVAARALEGKQVDARALLARVEMPLQAEPFERESLLLLTYGVTGKSEAAEAIIQQVNERGAAPFWFFRRRQAVALTMLERWAELDEMLGSLERLTQKGSPYLGALVEAIREEIAAAHGGPSPRHLSLQELGYVGWSQLLSHRAPAPERTPTLT